MYIYLLIFYLEAFYLLIDDIYFYDSTFSIKIFIINSDNFL